MAGEAQQAAHALTAAPGLHAGRHRAAGVIVVDVGDLVFLERLMAHRAGVPLGLQHLAELLRCQAVALEPVRLLPARSGFRGDASLPDPPLR